MENPFRWSISRHDSFVTCQRRYYYSYYAASFDSEVRRLKRLSALPLWAGSVVHETIEAFLRERRLPPTVTEQEAVIRSAVHEKMAAEWRESEGGSLRFRLFEHEYEVPVEAEDKKIAVGIVIRSLRQFFRAETLAEALAAGHARWRSLEDLVSFQVGDVGVLMRMDLAYGTSDGRVVIVDWKTGRSEGRNNAIQVAAYALYAFEKGWVRDVSQLRTRLEYLALARTIERELDQPALDRARDFIAKSAADMRALLADPAANRARIEDFSRIDRPQVCRRCNYRRLCFPRHEIETAPLPF
ncbi:MAG: PD-(D/E)XK nuclease family protein [Vicinamibacteria bacterium]|nr:PD-(D/E)XK nuclease family protein [Vicinamibacteria bacterium]